MGAILTVLILFLIFKALGSSSSNRKKAGRYNSLPARRGGPIISSGRAPEYFDIMEENYAEYKAKLIEDAKNGVMYKKSETMSLQDMLDGKTPVYKDVPAQEVLDDFLEYERRGYM